MPIRILLCLMFCLSALASPVVAAPEAPFLRFPEPFMWGTATAAYQVEGGISNNWSAAGVDAGQAINHYQRYDEDYAQAQTMGNNAWRMSIEWARIEPEPGRYDMQAVAHYRKMLQALRRRGLEPMVTLFHFTQPIWFEQKGGFSKEENIQDFVRFASFAAAQFKDEVSWWCTLNEPVVHAFKSYDQGAWPPFAKDRNLALRVIRNLILAHGRSYRAIHAADPIAWVGFAKHITLLEPHWPLNPADQLMTSLQSYLFNETFWQALETGELNFSAPGLDPILIAYDRELQGTMDYLGINYYTRYQIEASGAQRTLANVPVSDLNWEIHPQGLLKVLRMAGKHARRLKIPVIITENGLADAADSRRPQFLLEHLSAIWQAIDEGVPVRGYFHWSLIDNFEWTDGYEQRFGLLDAERQWRPSAHLYQRIATANGFPAQWLQALPEPLP